ncbi:hypothetical protein ACLB2K_058653 [Fragaria x ananassa]
MDETQVSAEIPVKAVEEVETNGKLDSCMKYVASSRSSKERLFSAPSLAQVNGKSATLQLEEGFKGHGMLAPFTAGSLSTDVHPLLIDKSEGSYVYDINGKKYLDALAGLWCTALGGNCRWKLFT